MSKVLVIDDDPVITSMFGHLLRAEGFSVETAADGEQGLKTLRQFRPDVVLLDLNLPRISGITWLRRIRRRAKSRWLPVVILTDGATRAQLKAAKNSDATLVLSKSAMRPGMIVEMISVAAGRAKFLT